VKPWSIFVDTKKSHNTRVRIVVGMAHWLSW